MAAEGQPDQVGQLPDRLGARLRRPQGLHRRPAGARGLAPRTRVDCDSSDYELVYTPCYLNGALAPVRDQTARWIQPKICLDGADLPAPLNFSSQTSGRFSIYGRNLIYTRSIPMVAGSQAVEFTFNKVDNSAASSFDTVVIKSLRFLGTTVGGAFTCDQCPLGSYAATAAASSCSLCPVGTYRNSISQIGCTPCSSTSYASLPGSTGCESCGHGIQSTADRASCDLMDCRFALSPSVVYDLSALRQANEMWGPVYDLNQHAYYLNICNKFHSNRTCFDASGVPIPAYACQVTNQGVGKDLGHVMGFYPLSTSHLSQGLLIENLHGSVSNSGCGGAERSSTIQMVCDPLAGAGFPEGIEPVETSRCVYTFLWRSLYACPLCTVDDYYPFLSACVNGNQTRAWLPLNDPPRCHDGAPRPSTEIVPCATSTSISCPPGQYARVDPATLLASCAPAPPGHYSIGGGKTWSSYEPRPAEFEGDWLGGPHYLMSGIGESTVELRVNLVVAGSISFQYKVYSTGDEAATDGFQFLIDGDVEVPLTTDTSFRYVSASAPLTLGPHVLRWAFRGGDAPSRTLRFKGALVRRVVVVGTSMAALQPIPCALGFYANASGSTSCNMCPIDTFSPTGSPVCQPCPTQSLYALPGSGSCSVRPVCTEDDFAKVYSACGTDGTRALTYVALQPQICRINRANVRDFVPPAAPLTGLPCAPCPPGTYPVNSTCASCPLGKGYVEGAGCSPAPAGAFAMPIKSYFVDDTISTWPTAFSSFCSGESCLSPKWRLRGTSIDSGVHHLGEIDAVLDLSVDLSTDGAISFTYSIMGDSGMDGLEFFVDGDQVPIMYSPDRSAEAARDEEDGETSRDDRTESVKLTSGSHLLRWVYHQDIGPGGVSMSNIQIQGDATGAATEINLCAPGTYTDAGSQLACQPCPAGTSSSIDGASSCTPCGDPQYQPDAGQLACIDCGAGTMPSADHTQCLTGCTWNFGTPEQPIAYNYSIIADSVYRGYVGNVDVLFHLCKFLPSDNTCIRPSGEPIASYVCGMDSSDGKVFDLGSYLEVEYLPGPDPNATAGSGIAFHFTRGDFCKGGTYWSTSVINHCYDDVLNTPIRRTFALNDCQFKIDMHNLYGCRVCTPADFEITRSECIDSKRTVSTVRKTACNSPFSASTYTESCSTSTTATTSSSSVSTPSTSSSVSTPSTSSSVSTPSTSSLVSSYEVETPLWVFLGLVIAFTIIAVVMIVFIVKHRQISAQYEVLLSTTSREPASGVREEIDLDE